MSEGSSYCQWCGNLVPAAEIQRKTTLEKQGDAWIESVWIGCTSCLRRKPR